MAANTGSRPGPTEPQADRFPPSTLQKHPILECRVLAMTDVRIAASERRKCPNVGLSPCLPGFRTNGSFQDHRFCRRPAIMGRFCGRYAWPVNDLFRHLKSARNDRVRGAPRGAAFQRFRPISISAVQAVIACTRPVLNACAQSGRPCAAASRAAVSQS